MAGALAVSGLQNVEATFLHRKFEVLHVLEVMFKNRADFHQLFVRCRHFFRQIANRMRRPHTGDDIFALRVNQIFTIEHLLAGCGVACETDARAGVVAHVSEHHRLHVRRGTDVVRNPLHSSVICGFVVPPGIENSVAGERELLVRVLWERIAGLFLNELLILDVGGVLRNRQFLDVQRGQCGYGTISRFRLLGGLLRGSRRGRLRSRAGERR